MLIVTLLLSFIACDDETAVVCEPVVTAWDGGGLVCDGEAVEVCYQYDGVLARGAGQPSACWYETSTGAYDFDCDEAALDGPSHQSAGAALVRDCF